MIDRLPGWRLAVVATLLCAFVSLGFSLASVVAPALISPGAERALVGPFAGYALSRSAAVAIAAVVASVHAAIRRAGAPLIAVGWTAAAIQGGDVLVGIWQGDVAKAIGPAVLAAFGAFALVRLGRPRPAGLVR